MKFKLEIELGNDAMKTPEDIARVLGQVAADLRSGWLIKKVVDENGNTVGRWEIGPAFGKVVTKIGRP